METTEILNLPVLPGLKGRSAPLLYGLADKKSICLINFIEEKNQSGDSNIKSYNLIVRNFGADARLALHLVKRITEWEKAGRPSINSIKVKAYFDKSNIVPSKNENLITKKWVSLLFSWKKEQ